MKILSRLLLIATVIFSGVTPVNLVSEPQKIVKIEIVHSHDHDDRHHHHHHHEEDSADLGSHEQSVAESGSSSPSESSKQHSHEILVSFGQTIFIESKPEFVAEFEIDSTHPDSQDISPPRNRSLSSIFRPPILS